MLALGVCGALGDAAVSVRAQAAAALANLAEGLRRVSAALTAAQQETLQQLMAGALLFAFEELNSLQASWEVQSPTAASFISERAGRIPWARCSGALQCRDCRLDDWPAENF